MSFDVQDGFFCEHLSFEHHCVKESYFVLRYFGSELYCLVEYVSVFNETIQFTSFTVSKGENIINVTFPLAWLGIVLLN